MFGPSTRVNGTWEEKWDVEGIQEFPFVYATFEKFTPSLQHYTKDDVTDRSLDRNCGSKSMWHFTAET